MKGEKKKFIFWRSLVGSMRQREAVKPQCNVADRGLLQSGQNRDCMAQAFTAWTTAFVCALMQDSLLDHYACLRTGSNRLRGLRQSHGTIEKQTRVTDPRAKMERLKVGGGDVLVGQEYRSELIYTHFASVIRKTVWPSEPQPNVRNET